MNPPSYRCATCSTRATVVMVPLDERDEHELGHLLERPLEDADAARAWLFGMHAIGYGAHPDDSGATLVRGGRGPLNMEPLYTAEQAERYDERMGEAHELLDDVYAVSLEALEANQ